MNRIGEVLDMDTKLKNEQQEKTRLLPRYKVLLHNDDTTPMDRVCAVIAKVFKFEALKCIALMMEAHRTGVALMVVEPKEHAEFHQEQLQSYGLTATIEPEV